MKCACGFYRLSMCNVLVGSNVSNEYFVSSLWVLMITDNCKQSKKFFFGELKKPTVKGKLEFWFQNSSFALTEKSPSFLN